MLLEYSLGLANEGAQVCSSLYSVSRSLLSSYMYCSRHAEILTSEA